MRDVLIDDYIGVDLAAVWEVTQQDLPGLKSKIAAILDDQSGKINWNDSQK